ncbi:MAG: hypothetical protein AB1721_00745 [Patescibacteria group bacterium]
MARFNILIKHNLPWEEALFRRGLFTNLLYIKLGVKNLKIQWKTDTADFQYKNVTGSIIIAGNAVIIIGQTTSLNGIKGIGELFEEAAQTAFHNNKPLPQPHA